MSSDEKTPEEFSVISLQKSRRKYRVDSRLLLKCFYIIFTRGMFFLGLTVATRHLWLMFVHNDLITTLSNPNRKFYQNQTLDEVTDRSLVVQPLIGEDQYFDIGVTIWARASAEEERDWWKTVNLAHFGRTQARTRVSGLRFSASVPDALFNIIYSDIVFKRVRLLDVSLTTVVNFSVPASYFPDLMKEWSFRIETVRSPIRAMEQGLLPRDGQEQALGK